MHCIFSLDIVHHYNCIRGERAPTLNRGGGNYVFVHSTLFGKIEKAEYLAWKQRMFSLARGKRVCFEDHLPFCLSVLKA